MHLPPKTIAVLANSPKAKALAEATKVSLFQGDIDQAFTTYNQHSVDETKSQQDGAAPRFMLAYLAEGLSLIDLSQPKVSPLRVDFLRGEHRHRRQFGGGKGQMIAKAVGIQGSFRPFVADVTAGLGGDAYVLACLGCKVKMMERSVVVHALLEDGLQRGREALSEEAAVIEKMDLHLGESKKDLSLFKGCDVVYLDPMFPERKKSAKVKKEMRIFHDLLGVDADDSELLAQALQVAKYRVVVKRPRLAPAITGIKPSYQLEGKSCRYDIYTLQKMPTKPQLGEQ